MGMTVEELREMVKSIVAEAVEPLQKQTTDWMAKILAGASQPKPERPEDKGLKAARYLRALAAGKGDPERAARYVAQKWGDEALVKALNETNLAEGGALVPPEYVAELIELLRGRTVVRSLGATVLPMNSGSATIPKLTGGATASYVGESSNITKSQPSTGQLQLSAKKLAALVPTSNDLLRDSSPAADTVVRDDLVSALALREDLGFIRDDGTAPKPKGMRYWAPAGNLVASTGTTLAAITADVAKMVNLLESANVRFLRPGWIMTPRSKWFLWQLLDSNGNPVFRAELNQGKFLTFPFRTSTQIPNNLGVGTNESEVYLADFADMVIGENTELIIDVSTEAAYHDGTNVVAAFSRDETVMRAIARHDFGARHEESIAVLTGVTWGA
ncbi:MAG: phage major capsid protein [Bacillota bacterium]|nr:phage major capsid protein [Bacillota bacterium]